MSDEHVTLLAPDLHSAPGRGASSGFPSDLLGQFAARLRTLALLYAAVFLLAGVVPQLTIAEDRDGARGEHAARVEARPGVETRHRVEAFLSDACTDKLTESVRR